MRINCLQYIQRFLKIRTKAGKVVPFRLNIPQQRLYEVFKAQWEAGKPVRIIILKARQMGFSTLTEAILFFLTVTRRFVETMIVTHKREATSNLFLMAKRFYDELPDALRPCQKASNAQELVFDKPAKADGPPGLGSRIRCATAGGHGVGRGSTINCLHLSEFAFWPGDKRETFTGLVQAVPDLPGTVIIIESTANGFDEFKQMWDDAVDAQRKGEDGYIPVFFPWFDMPEYRRKPSPGFRRTAEEDEIAKAFGLDDEQLAWRRWCIANQCGGDINLFHQEYPSTPEEAFIATGSCVFDKDAVIRWLDVVRDHAWERGAFSVAYGSDGKIVSYRWQPDEKGPVRIRVKPEAGVPYVLGGDTAGEGSDFFAGHVLDNRTGEQVAVIHHQFGERAFAEQVYCLGRYYNDALVGVEVNYSTYPEKLLEELGYHRLYVRERVDTFTGKTVNAFGFETTAKTRPLIIDQLKDVAKYDLSCIHDPETLKEMLTFVYDENRRPQAEQGEHDDLVMSLAIAHFIRNQQRSACTGSVVAKADNPWTKDMWDDYNKASRSEREMMVRLWGEPR